jgi:hypothetical protein
VSGRLSVDSTLEVLSLIPHAQVWKTARSQEKDGRVGLHQLRGQHTDVGRGLGGGCQAICQSDRLVYFKTFFQNEEINR